MNLNLAVDGGSVEVADTAFSREYNEALVHQVVVAYGWGSTGLALRRTDLRSAVAVALGDKKENAGPRASRRQHVRQFGAPVV